MRSLIVVFSSFILVGLYVNTVAIWRAFGIFFGTTARDALPVLTLVLPYLGQLEWQHSVPDSGAIFRLLR